MKKEEKLELFFDSIGADPEFAISRDGKMLPSFMFIDGTKENPEHITDGFAILKDNLLVEGNIPPCQTKEEFVTTMKRLKAMIAERIGNCVLVHEDVVEYSDDYIFSEDGQMFGCSSYVNVYLMESLPSPDLYGNSRQIGSHIHIGYTMIENTSGLTKDQVNIAIGRAMDFFVGIPSDDIHYSEERRSAYGKLGSIRMTTYGLEYRSLGGYFMRDEFLEWQYEQTEKAIKFVSNIDNYNKLMVVDSADIKYYDFLEIDLEAQVPQKKLIKSL